MAGVSQHSPLTPARQRAQALAESGDLAGARAVLERAVELGKINLAEDDPDVLLTACQLGSLLRKADDPAAARRVLEEAYAAGQWRLGDAAALMLRISHDLGVVAEELGNRHEARKAFGRVSELGPGVLGADHWLVARARAYLGQDQGPSPVRAEPSPTAPSPLAGPSGQVWSPSPGTPAAGHGLPPTSLRTFPATPSPRAGGQHGLPAVRAIEEPTSVPPIVGPLHGFGPPAPVPARPYLGARDAASYGRGGVGLFAAIAAVLAAIIAVAALVFGLAHRSEESAGDPDVPTLGGPAPRDVRLRDGGTRISVTWRDPSEGTVSFLVAMGHPGEQLKPVSTLGPGQTSYEMSALNPSLDYCFAVLAVYRGNEFATSPQACTARVTGSATPR